VKQASAHLLVMYVKTPPKFLTWWKLNVWLKIPPDVPSMTVASAAAAAAVPRAEPSPESAA